MHCPSQKILISSVYTSPLTAFEVYYRELVGLQADAGFHDVSLSRYLTHVYGFCSSAEYVFPSPENRQRIKI